MSPWQTVVPHAVHEERPARGLVVQLIRELQPRGIGRAKGVDLGGGVLAHGGDLRLGVLLRGKCTAARLSSAIS